jgi:GntR family transcriptional repressor for pyruvate dehydrogenase complex
LTYESDNKVYQRVIDYIGDQVDKGLLRKGDKIPTERKLVEILGIGRNSIREALKILDIIGVCIKLKLTTYSICSHLKKVIT